MIETVIEGLKTGTLAPYLGPEMLALAGTNDLPKSTLALSEALAKKVTPPGRIRKEVHSVAQYIESRKHRKTLVALMHQIFATDLAPSPLHCWLAKLKSPLIVSLWYDDLMAKALQAQQARWAAIQGVSQAEKAGSWTLAYDQEGHLMAPGKLADTPTILYQPWGSVTPSDNFVISDADFVELLTEIDIQTPIPLEIQNRRKNLGFVFLGCRFLSQTERIFARQIKKRSQGPHFALLTEEPSKNEARFLKQENIEPIPCPLEEFDAALAQRLLAENNPGIGRRENMPIQ
jgi:hypothetical protein